MKDLPPEVEAKISLLPPDVRELVRQLPQEKLLEILPQLIQSAQLSYRALTERDVDNIKARTAEGSAYGFLSADVDFTWQEVSQPSYVAIGAFDEERQDEAGGPDIPVAFIIAEVSRLDETQEFYWDASDLRQGSSSSSQAPLQPQSAAGEAGPHAEGAAAGTSASRQAAAGETAGSPSGGGEGSENNSSSAVGGGSTVQGDVEEIQDLLQAAGWLPSDVIVSIYYIGVDYEYRRQGIGRELLDCVKEVAQGARARMMWLNVAEYNPSALAFYLNYGFQKTQEFKKGQRGNHYLCVYPLHVPRKGLGRGDKGGSRGRKQQGKSGKPPAGKGKGFAVQAMSGPLMASERLHAAHGPGRLHGCFGQVTRPQQLGRRHVLGAAVPRAAAAGALCTGSRASARSVGNRNRLFLV